MNIFAVAVVVLFSLAGLIEYINNNPAKGYFYILSALINISALFMKG